MYETECVITVLFYIVKVLFRSNIILMYLIFLKEYIDIIYAFLSDVCISISTYIWIHEFCARFKNVLNDELGKK